MSRKFLALILFCAQQLVAAEGGAPDDMGSEVLEQEINTLMRVGGQIEEMRDFAALRGARMHFTPEQQEDWKLIWTKPAGSNNADLQNQGQKEEGLTADLPNLANQQPLGVFDGENDLFFLDPANPKKVREVPAAPVVPEENLGEVNAGGGEPNKQGNAAPKGVDGEEQHNVEPIAPVEPELQPEPAANHENVAPVVPAENLDEGNAGGGELDKQGNAAPKVVDREEQHNVEQMLVDPELQPEPAANHENVAPVVPAENLDEGNAGGGEPNQQDAAAPKDVDGEKQPHGDKEPVAPVVQADNLGEGNAGGGEPNKQGNAAPKGVDGEEQHNVEPIALVGPELQLEPVANHENVAPVVPEENLGEVNAGGGEPNQQDAAAPKDVDREEQPHGDNVEPALVEPEPAANAENVAPVVQAENLDEDNEAPEAPGTPRPEPEAQGYKPVEDHQGMVDLDLAVAIAVEPGAIAGVAPLVQADKLTEDDADSEDEFVDARESLDVKAEVKPELPVVQNVVAKRDNKFMLGSLQSLVLGNPNLFVHSQDDPLSVNLDFPISSHVDSDLDSDDDSWSETSSTVRQFTLTPVELEDTEKRLHGMNRIMYQVSHLPLQAKGVLLRRLDNLLDIARKEAGPTGKVEMLGETNVINIFDLRGSSSLVDMANSIYANLSPDEAPEFVKDTIEDLRLERRTGVYNLLQDHLDAHKWLSKEAVIDALQSSKIRAGERFVSGGASARRFGAVLAAVWQEKKANEASSKCTNQCGTRIERQTKQWTSDAPPICGQPLSAYLGSSSFSAEKSGFSLDTSLTKAFPTRTLSTAMKRKETVPARASLIAFPTVTLESTVMERKETVPARASLIAFPTVTLESTAMERKETEPAPLVQAENLDEGNAGGGEPTQQGNAAPKVVDREEQPHGDKEPVAPVVQGENLDEGNAGGGEPNKQDDAAPVVQGENLDEGNAGGGEPNQQDNAAQKVVEQPLDNVEPEEQPEAIEFFQRYVREDLKTKSTPMPEDLRTLIIDVYNDHETGARAILLGRACESIEEALKYEKQDKRRKMEGCMKAYEVYARLYLAVKSGVNITEEEASELRGPTMLLVLKRTDLQAYLKEIGYKSSWDFKNKLIHMDKTF